IIMSILVFTQTLTYLSGCTMEIGTEKYYAQFSSIITQDDPYANVKSRLNMNQISSGFSSFSGFCSMIDENTVSTYTTLGYAENFHDISTIHSNLFADLLSGIKYEISDVELNLPWLTKVSQNEKSYLYQYNLYLGHAYYVDNLPQIDNDEEFLINLNKIYKSLSKDEEDLLVKLDAKLEYSSTPKEVEKGLKFEEETKATFTLNTPNFDSVIYLKTCYNNNVNYNSKSVNNEGSTFIEYCGVEKEQLSYTLDISKSTTIEEIYFYALDYNKLVALYKMMSTDLPQVEYTSDTITIDFKNVSGKYLVVNHPQIYGYEYTLNDAKVEPQSFIGFVAFDIENLSSGKATIAFTYPLIKISLICLAIGLTVVVLLVFLAFFCHKLPKKFLSVVLYGFTAVAITLSIYFFVVPIVLMMIPI
ncbi:MAG: YfhO family protein, partial [Clostridia bacterium]|nr:YfhO family protein [Clostridia bacterium]